MTAPTGSAPDGGTVVAEYRRALDGFDATLAAVPAGAWDLPSRCDAWTLGDVTGHVAWGLQLVASLATGDARPGRDGAPGAPHPRVVVGDDPLEGWRAVRGAAIGAITPAALERVVELGGAFGTRPLGRFVRVIALVDTPAHTWDVGAAVGLDVQLDPELAARGLALARTLELTRNAPGGIKDPLPPPPGAGAPVQLLAFLGRRAW